MTNPLTAESAREIARTLKLLTWSDPSIAAILVSDEAAEQRAALALIDQVIDTLEMCAKEHCSECARGSCAIFNAVANPPYYWHGRTTGPCMAQFERREIARLRAEREKLTQEKP